MRIEESVVLITGGASGLGKSIAISFYQNGARVIVIDVNDDALKELNTAFPDIATFSCDVTIEEQVSQIISKITEAFSRIDILINNAGVIHSEPLFNLMSKNKRHSIESWRKVVDVNLTSVFMITSYVVEKMILNRVKGLIINISSISAKGNEGQSAYSASKAGVEALTKVWAKELGRFGIRSVAVAPGFMDTKSTHDGMNDQLIADVKQEIPLKKLGNPDEIAKTMLALVENDFINKTIIDVDGGMVI